MPTDTPSRRTGGGGIPTLGMSASHHIRRNSLSSAAASLSSSTHHHHARRQRRARRYSNSDSSLSSSHHKSVIHNLPSPLFKSKANYSRLDQQQQQQQQQPQVHQPFHQSMPTTNSNNNNNHNDGFSNSWNNDSDPFMTQDNSMQNWPLHLSPSNNSRSKANLGRIAATAPDLFQASAPETHGFWDPSPSPVGSAPCSPKKPSLTQSLDHVLQLASHLRGADKKLASVTNTTGSTSQDLTASWQAAESIDVFSRSSTNHNDSRSSSFVHNNNDIDDNDCDNDTVQERIFPHTATASHDPDGFLSSSRGSLFVEPSTWEPNDSGSQNDNNGFGSFHSHHNNHNSSWSPSNALDGVASCPDFVQDTTEATSVTEVSTFASSTSFASQEDSTALEILAQADESNHGDLDDHTNHDDDDDPWVETTISPLRRQKQDLRRHSFQGSTSMTPEPATLFTQVSKQPLRTTEQQEDQEDAALLSPHKNKNSSSRSSTRHHARIPIDASLLYSPGSTGTAVVINTTQSRRSRSVSKSRRSASVSKRAASRGTSRSRKKELEKERANLLVSPGTPSSPSKKKLKAKLVHRSSPSKKKATTGETEQGKSIVDRLSKYVVTLQDDDGSLNQSMGSLNLSPGKRSSNSKRGKLKKSISDAQLSTKDGSEKHASSSSKKSSKSSGEKSDKASRRNSLGKEASSSTSSSSKTLNSPRRKRDTVKKEKTKSAGDSMDPESRKAKRSGKRSESVRHHLEPTTNQ